MSKTSKSTDLVGQWLLADGRVMPDDSERLIEEMLANHLQRLAVSEDGWSGVRRDRRDSSYLELTYVDGSAQGGGPRRLRSIPPEIVASKYKLGS